MGYKSATEWFMQADYDLETAKVMLSSGRNIYAVFMAHLSIEKALKGLWADIFKEDAPKTHNLIFLYSRLSVELPEELKYIVDELNQVSIPTRYPETLDKLFNSYPKDRTEKIITNTEKVLQWLKTRI
ncbi:MAG: HEPN domain-containing protein [bacterium]